MTSKAAILVTDDRKIAKAVLCVLVLAASLYASSAAVHASPHTAGLASPASRPSTGSRTISLLRLCAVEAPAPDANTDQPLNPANSAASPLSSPANHPGAPPAVASAGQLAPRKPVSPAATIWQQEVMGNGHWMRATIVAARLSTVRVRCGIAAGGAGAVEPLASIAGRYGAVAAINGSFFDAYDPGPVKRPDNTLISQGNLIEYSQTGTILGFTDDGQWRMDRALDVVHMCGASAAKFSYDDQNAYAFWSRVTEAIACGPRLVVDGEIELRPWAEEISSPEVLNTRTTRSAVGITRDGHILLVVVDRADLHDMAHVMLNLGAVQAMNLDGGNSSGLWFRGHTSINPGRWLSNALLIVPR